MAEIREVQDLAHRLLVKHRLSVSFTLARLRSNAIGYCDYTPCVHAHPTGIVLSEEIAQINPLASCEQIILHEIAHVLAGYRANHGPVWTAIARDIGVLNPSPVAEFGILLPEGRWNGYCYGCSVDHPIDTAEIEPPYWLIGLCPDHQCPVYWLPRGTTLAEKLQVRPLDRAA